MSHLFAGQEHANIYSKYRPSAPESLMNRIFNFLAEKIAKSEWNIAIDVGCGTGQNSLHTVKQFKTFYGFDVSEAQIKVANERNNLSNVFYEASPAETIPRLATNSVQLATTITAVHYFDFDKFVQEMGRVLVPGGVLALSSNFLPKVEPIDAPGDTRIGDAILDFYTNELREYRNINSDKVRNKYQGLEFPDNFEVVRDKEWYESRQLGTCADAIGFFKSMSPYQTCLKENPEKANEIISTLENKIKDIVKVDKLEEKLAYVVFEYFLVLGRKLK